MNSPSDSLVNTNEESSLDTNSFLNSALSNIGSTSYPSDTMTAFVPPHTYPDGEMMRAALGLQPHLSMNTFSTSPQLSNGAWGDKDTFFSGGHSQHWPTSIAGLSLQTSFAGPSAFQSQTSPEAVSPETLFSAQSLPDAKSFGGTIEGVDGIDAEPQSLKKRSTGTDEMPAPKKSRGGRKGRATKTQAQPEANSEDEGAKREKFLERNRLAASKCRQKKKEWTNQLEEKARELTNSRHVLTAEVAMLKNELLELKCKCLEHSNCECGLIRDYLKKALSSMSPTSAFFADSDLGDRRPSEVSVSSFDEGTELSTSRRPSISIESSLSTLSSPKTAPDVDAKIRTALGSSLGVEALAQLAARMISADIPWLPPCSRA